MEEEHSSQLEFSLVDAILPLVEMWKLLVILPIVVAGLVYIVFQFPPADRTYGSDVHLPLEQAQALITEITVNRSLAPVVASGVTVPATAEIIASLQMTPVTEDQTHLSLSGPADQAVPEVLGAITEMLAPTADAYLRSQKEVRGREVAESERTIAALHASEVDLTEALEDAKDKYPAATAEIGELTLALSAAGNALYRREAVALAAQAKLNELRAAKPTVNVELESSPQPKRERVALLSGGGALLLALLFIFVRQEILFAASHEGGRQKLDKIAQYLKIFPERGRPKGDSGA
jgi:hypothetical protein